MIERFIGQIPFWARRDHPVLGYELQKNAPKLSRSARYLRALFVLLFCALLLLGGYALATGFFSSPAGDHPTEAIYSSLYSPLLVLQMMVAISAFFITSGVIGEKKRTGAWDSLRATENGVALTLRTRWASVFYRLRGFFSMIFALRVVLIGVILYNLTSFQGRHLDLYIVGITPHVSLMVAVVLLAFLMTATLLLPFTSVGFDAALGVLLSTFVQQRVYLTIIQLVYSLGRAALAILLVLRVELVFIYRLIDSNPTYFPDGIDVFLSAVWGDLGLSQLYLPRAGETWATIPFGIFLGLGLLIYALIQSALADVILSYAVRRAQRRG